MHIIIMTKKKKSSKLGQKSNLNGRFKFEQITTNYL